MLVPHWPIRKTGVPCMDGQRQHATYLTLWTNVVGQYQPLWQNPLRQQVNVCIYLLLLLLLLLYIITLSHYYYHYNNKKDNLNERKEYHSLDY